MVKTNKKDKVFLVICDGLGDRPIAEFSERTPLEAAETPNLDRLAKEGVCGLMDPIGPGIIPHSDNAHLCLFGYDPKTYYPGRGPFEVAGLNMKVQPGDICLRANMGTINAKGEIVDRRAGRIDDISEYVKMFNGIEIDGITFLLKPGVAYRLGVIMRGKGLSAQITDVDPRQVGVEILKAKPKDDSQEAKFTAATLNKFVQMAKEKLRDYPANIIREQQGKLPANCFLLRGAGKYPDLPSFNDRYGLRAVVMAGGGLYKGIGRLLGMKVTEVKGATGKPDTDIQAKINQAIRLFDDYDFFFIHIKATDSLGHDGNYQGKKEFIAKIDKAMSPFLELKKALVIVTADHSTPCELKDHSTDSVPLLIHGRQIQPDQVISFGERACLKGSLGKIKGLDLMPLIIKLLPLIKTREDKV